MKLDERNPAYSPAVSFVLDGTNCSTMYPLYGKTLKSVKNMVKTLLHNPKVLMK
jgi:hypothetical protein